MDAVEDAPPSGPPGPTWPRRSIIAIATCLTASAILLFVASRLLDSERVANWLEPRLSHALGRDVAIASARVKLLPLGIRLEHIEVDDPTELTSMLAGAEGVELRVRLIPLLRREVVVGRVVVDRPVVDVRVGPDGVSNLAHRGDDIEPPTEEQRPLTLDLRAIHVREGRLSYEDVTDSTSAGAESFELRSSLRRSTAEGWALRGSANAIVDVGTRAAPPLGPLAASLELELEADADFDVVTLRAGTLRLEPMTFDVTGTLVDVRQPMRAVDLTISTRGWSVRQATRWLPDGVQARIGAVEGVLAADLRVSGSLGNGSLPAVAGTVTLERVRVESRSGIAVAEGIQATVELSADGAITPSVRGDVLGGPLTLDGVVTSDTARVARLAVQAIPDLGLLTQLAVLPEGMTLSGRLGARVDVDVPLRDPTTALGTGELTLADLRVTTPRLGVPVSVQSGPLRVEGTRISFEDLSLAFGEERLLVSGELRDPGAFAVEGRTPYLEAFVRGPRLTWTYLSPRAAPDTSLTYGRVAFARLGARDVSGLSAEEAAGILRLARPSAPPVAGRVQVELDTLVDRRGISEAVRATAEVGPTFVRVSAATMRRYGGRITGGLNLALGPGSAEAFTMRLNAEEVDASAFLDASTPLGRTLRGALSFEMDLTGSLDSLLLPTSSALLGGGRLRVDRGGLRATPLTERLATFLGMPELREPSFRSWSTPFEVSGAAVHFAQTPLEGAPGLPRFGGSMAFDGRLELVGVVDLPRSRIDSVLVGRLGRAGALAVRALDTGEVTQATVRVGGTLSAPEVTGGANANTGAITQGIQEAATREIREEIQERRQDLEERAAGYLRDLIRRRLPGRMPPDTIRGR